MSMMTRVLYTVCADIIMMIEITTNVEYTITYFSPPQLLSDKYWILVLKIV